MGSRRSDNEELRLELLAYSPNQRSLAANLRRFLSEPFIYHLVDHSYSLRFEDRAAGLAEAQLAQDLASRMDSRELRAVAAANLGNMLRCNARLREAEDAFHAAISWALSCSRDVQTRILELLASLRIRQARWGEATSILTQVVDTRKASGDDRRTAAAMIQLSQALNDGGEPAKALKTVSQALSLLEPTDYLLRLAAHHNATKFLIDLGESEEALHSYFRFSHLYDRAEIGPMHQPKRAHLHAHIAEGLHLDRLAEDEFRRAMALYDATAQHDLTAVTALELAALLVRQGRRDDAQPLIAAALPRLRALGVGEDSVEARTLCAALAAQLTAATIQRAVRFLTSRAS